jgi:hypothetical protein
MSDNTTDTAIPETPVPSTVRLDPATIDDRETSERIEAAFKAAEAAEAASAAQAEAGADTGRPDPGKPDGAQTASPPPENDEEGDAIPEFALKKADEWRNAKRAIRERIEKREAEKLKAELAKYADYETLKQSEETNRKQADELREKLYRYDVEARPEFQRMNDRAKILINTAKLTAGQELSAKIEEAFKLTTPNARQTAIDAIMDSMPPARAARLAATATEFEVLQMDKQEQIAVQARQESVRQSQEKQAVEQRKSAIAAAFNGQLDAFRKTDPVLAGFLDDNTTSRARSVFYGDAKPEEAARAAIMEAIGPKLFGLLDASTKREAALKAELEKLRSVEPKVTGQNASGARPEPEKFVDDESAMMARISAAWNA